MDFTDLRNMLRTHHEHGRKRAVLLCTGSLCPVHKGHLEHIDVAAIFLSEEYKIDSLVAYISPSCDSYVYAKLGNDMIPFVDRYEMTKLACKEHNEGDHYVKIVPDYWEGSQKEFIPFPYVRKHFENEIKKEFPNDNLLVLYVSGADHFMKCKLYKKSGYVGTSRIGYDIKAKTNEKQHVYVCKDEKYQQLFSNISSTAIRQARKNGQPIYGLTYDSVIKYLHDRVGW